MRLSFWRYQLILVLLYFFWSIFFTSPTPTIFSQIAFNFAVFYPVGLLAGHQNQKGDTKKNILEVCFAALVFNLLTYGLAYLGGITFQEWSQNWSLVLIDFLSMFLLIGLGMIFGDRLRKK